jgi:hypothetical protein
MHLLAEMRLVLGEIFHVVTLDRGSKPSGPDIGTCLAAWLLQRQPSCVCSTPFAKVRSVRTKRDDPPLRYQGLRPWRVSLTRTSKYLTPASSLRRTADRPFGHKSLLRPYFVAPPFGYFVPVSALRPCLVRPNDGHTCHSPACILRPVQVRLRICGGPGMAPCG